MEPLRAAPLTSLEYAVVDVETTGRSPFRGHRIIELALVEIRGESITGMFRSLVNPGRPISRWVTRLTGISNDTVQYAPTFEEVAPEVYRRLGGKVFVGHNAHFDWCFLRAQLAPVLGTVADAPTVCTLRLARRLLPGRPCKNLGALASHFGIEIRDRHRAYGDAEATARIFLRMMVEVRDVGIVTWGDLERLMSGQLTVEPLPGGAMIQAEG